MALAEVSGLGCSLAVTLCCFWAPGQGVFQATLGDRLIYSSFGTSVFLPRWHKRDRERVEFLAPLGGSQRPC